MCIEYKGGMCIGCIGGACIQYTGGACIQYTGGVCIRYTRDMVSDTEGVCVFDEQPDRPNNSPRSERLTHWTHFAGNNNANIRQIFHGLQVFVCERPFLGVISATSYRI